MSGPLPRTHWVLLRRRLVCGRLRRTHKGVSAALPGRGRGCGAASERLGCRLESSEYNDLISLSPATRVL